MQPIEQLETRKLLSASINLIGTMRVVGEVSVDNNINVSVDAGDAVVTMNGDELLRTSADFVKRVYIHGADGSDTITVAEGVGNLVRVFGHAGDDTITAGSRSIQRGGAGDDVLNGSSAKDLLHGSIGDDTINGNGGNDYIRGSDGNDVISGGDGRDLILAGGGDDVVSGGTGNDLLIGSAGNDLLNGDDGEDRLYGGPGTDTLNGNAGIDSLFGGVEEEDDAEDVLDAGGSDGDSEDFNGAADPQPGTGRGLRGLWAGDGSPAGGGTRGR